MEMYLDCKSNFGRSTFKIAKIAKIARIAGILLFAISGDS